ncbi:MAG: hypothetical protein WBC91_03035 [Phototrophicaceae bacterium]
MYDKTTEMTILEAPLVIDLKADTARWTSSFYSVEFEQLSEIVSEQPDSEAFRISAWGISRGLHHLLGDYSAHEIKQAADWLVIHQNAHVVVLLSEAMTDADFNFSVLDQVFISIDAELFLPRGLRMHVTCITNIVQAGSDLSSLDKFVAILDPGEARKYILERRGTHVSSQSAAIH